MNRTNAILVTIIVVLAASFAWYVSRHPATPGNGSVAAASTADLPAATSLAPRTLNADLDAAGLDKLALDASVGEMHVRPSPDGGIHVQVTLRPKEQEFMWFFHWMSQGTARGIAAASIHQEKRDSTLSLSLDYPDVQQDNLKQEWEVEMPVKLALDARLRVGELTIEGVAGGVVARLDVGELGIDTPKGSIDGTVNVGEIRAKSASTAHGKIDLSSSIGEAVLTVGGKQTGYHEHGGLGNMVTAEGDGPDSMRLNVNVGEASLRLNPGDDAGLSGGHI